jgi:hypothetical protein
LIAALLSARIAPNKSALISFPWRCCTRQLALFGFYFQTSIMPTLQDVKLVLYTATKTILERLGDLERMMIFINSMEDIRKNEVIVRAIIQIRKVIDLQIS